MKSELLTMKELELGDCTGPFNISVPQFREAILLMRLEKNARNCPILKYFSTPFSFEEWF